MFIAHHCCKDKDIATTNFCRMAEHRARGVQKQTNLLAQHSFILCTFCSRSQQVAQYQPQSYRLVLLSCSMNVKIAPQCSL